MTVEERVKFLSQVFFLKDWETHRLNHIAHALTQSGYNKGCTIVKNNEISKDIYFVLRGQVDVLPFSDSKSALLSIQKYDYFGESGFMNSNTHVKSSKSVTEAFTMKALTRVDLLVLSELEFHLIDRATADVISNYFTVRTDWREIRCAAVLQEMKVFRDFSEKNTSIKPINENRKGSIKEKAKEREKEKEKEKRGDFEVLNQNIEKNMSFMQKKNIFPSSSSVPSTVSSYDELHSLLTRSHGVSNSSLSNLSSYSHNEKNNHFFSPQLTDRNSGDITYTTVVPKNVILQSLNYQLSSALEEISNNRNCKNTAHVNRMSSNISKNSSTDLSGSSSSISTARENYGNSGKYRNDEKASYGIVPGPHENKIPHLFNLEDIPYLLDDGYDPLMVISAAHNNRDKIRINNNLMYLKSPQLGRMNDHTSKKNQIENIKKFPDLAKLKGISFDDLSRHQLFGSSDHIGSVKNHIFGVENTVFDDNHHTDKILTSHDKVSNNGMMKSSVKNCENSHLADQYLTPSGCEKSILFGSTKIASVKSSHQVLTPIDNFHNNN